MIQDKKVSRNDLSECKPKYKGRYHRAEVDECKWEPGWREYLTDIVSSTLKHSKEHNEEHVTQ